MASAYAIPAAAHASLRAPLATLVPAALASLAVAGAATALLLPRSAAPPNTTMLTPVVTTVASR